MKIAHVVTYVSPDGAFGGPTRVALGQAQALAELGHDVTVYAAAPPALAGTTFRDGYTLRTFPARRVAPLRGFAAMISPQLDKVLKADVSRFDIAHIHLARDLVTIPAAMRFKRAGVPYVVQTHGMVDASKNPLTIPLDAWATRPLLRAATTVLTLTSREIEDISDIEPAAVTTPISNGIRVGAIPAYAGREKIVLFLARLHSRKRPLAFVDMARILAPRLPGVQFVLAGPDEGEGDSVRAAIASAELGDQLAWIGAVSPDETQDLLAAARAYVLPSHDEVFPMSVLEAFRAGTPVVVTDSLGIAADCQSFGAAIITDGTPTTLARAVNSILTSPTLAEELRGGASSFIRSKLDVRGVAERLASIYVTHGTRDAQV